MSKFLVDELPYYEDECIFFITGMCYQNNEDCPRYWNKYKVSSEDNPHECIWLKEYEGEQE